MTLPAGKQSDAFSRLQLPGQLFLNCRLKACWKKQHYPGRTQAMLKAAVHDPGIMVVIELELKQAPELTTDWLRCYRRR